MRSRAVPVFLLILGLLGCQALHPAAPIAPTSPDRSRTALEARAVRGRVDFASERSAQALPGDVVNAATVSFIDTSSNATVATGKTDAAGAFTLGLGSYNPVTGGTYVLEAVKGLNNQAAGGSAVRFRTILQWNGTAWLSCTNGAVGGTIVIDALTTALAIESSLDAADVPPAQTIGKVDVATSPASLKATPGPYANHPDSEIDQLAADLLANLGANVDPVASVPAISPTISSFTPTSGPLGGLVAITGAGFSPVLAGNTVTLNGTSAQVLLATPTSLVVIVPSGATSGPIRVTTGRGSATGASFTVGASVGSLSIAGFSPTEGRAGTVVTLTGQFGTGTATPSVRFNGVPAAVTAWAPTSMTIAAPVGATPGPISVQSGTVTAASEASFDQWAGEVGLLNQIYSANGSGAPYQLPGNVAYEQIVQAGNHVYVIGGYHNSGQNLSDVYMLPIQADGSLGQAVRVSSLNTARRGAPSFASGGYLFCMGGTAASYLTSIERAAINADGTLGPWVTLGVTMPTARYALPALCRGSDVYLVSGASSSGDSTTIDRWTVDGSGNISLAGTYNFTISGAPAKIDWNAGAVLGSSLVLVGGRLNGAYSSQTIRLPINADGSVGDGTAAPYNLPQTEYAPGQLGVVGSNVYVWGGYNGATSLYTSNVYHAPFDATTGQLTGTWVQDPSLNATSSVILGVAPLTNTNRLWAIGGGDQNWTGTIQTTTAKGDGSLEPWSTYGGMTYWREGAAIRVFGNKAWLLGGYGRTTNGSSAYITSTEYFPIEADGTLGPSTVGPSLNFAHYNGGYFSANGYVYVTSGYTGGTREPSVERARINGDGTIGPFVTLSSALVIPRHAQADAVVGDYYYVFGGALNGGGLTNTIERCRINSDGSLGPFQVLPQVLPEASAHMRAAVVGKYVYLVGQYTGSATSNVYGAPIYTDGSIGTFARGPSLLTAVYQPTVAPIGNYLYAFGGFQSDGQSIVQRIGLNPDGTLSSAGWSYVSSSRSILPYATSYVRDVALYGNNLYLFGGYISGVDPILKLAQGTVR